MELPSFSASEEDLSSPLYSPLSQDFDFVQGLGSLSSPSALDDFLSDPAAPFGSPVKEPSPVLELYHKPRGSKGIWVKVEYNEKIRVAKAKGKKLKMELDLSNMNVELDRSNIKLLLKDQQGLAIANGEDPTAFTLDSQIWNGRRIELEVKLFRMARNIRFCIQIQTKSGNELLMGNTVEFSTHNSGNSAKTSSGANKLTLDMLPEVHPFMAAQLIPIDKKRKLQEEILQIPTSLGACSVDAVSDEVVTSLPGSLEVNGRVRARLFAQFSDMRLKVNITDIVDALEIVTKLQGKTYEWKSSEVEEDDEGPRRVIGLIAQEVYTILPEVVHEDKQTGLLSISYTELIPVLIEAFKQFLKEYEEDKSTMRMQLDNMKEKLELLSGKLDRADQDYMPNVHKAIADLKIATMAYVEQTQQYAYDYIDQKVSAVQKKAYGIVEGVNSRIQYVRDTVSGVSSKLQSVKDHVPGIPSITDTLWVLPYFVIARRPAGG